MSLKYETVISIILYLTNICQLIVITVIHISHKIAIVNLKHETVISIKFILEKYLTVNSVPLFDIIISHRGPTPFYEKSASMYGKTSQLF